MIMLKSECCVLDINECVDSHLGLVNGGCEHTCSNSDGSYQCSCHSGYELVANLLNCDGTKDINHYL